MKTPKPKSEPEPEPEPEHARRPTEAPTGGDKPVRDELPRPRIIMPRHLGRKTLALLIAAGTFVTGTAAEYQWHLIDRVQTAISAPADTRPTADGDQEGVNQIEVAPITAPDRLTSESGCIRAIRMEFPGRTLIGIRVTEIGYDALTSRRDLLFTFRLTNPDQPTMILCAVHEATGRIQVAGPTWRDAGGR